MSTCPRCNSALTATDYGGVDLEACDQCGGRWITPDNLRTIVESDDLPPPAAPAPGKQPAEQRPDLYREGEHPRCPGCGQAMDEFNYAGDTGIILDKCHHCGGLWLDAGELEQVRAAVGASKQDLDRDIKRFSGTLHQLEVREDAREQKDTSVTPNPLLSALASRTYDEKEGV